MNGYNRATNSSDPLFDLQDNSVSKSRFKEFPEFVHLHLRQANSLAYERFSNPKTRSPAGVAQFLKEIRRKPLHRPTKVEMVSFKRAEKMSPKSMTSLKFLTTRVAG